MSETSPFQSSLDVLMATTSYPLDATDWKGRFVYELAAALDRTGEARCVMWGPAGRLPGNVVSANSAEDTVWLQRMARAGGIAHLLKRHPPSGLLHAAGILSRLRRTCRRSRADLYHVNWLQLALGLPDDSRPAYVAVLGSDYGLLRIPGMTSILRRTFARRRTVLAPNAGWMASKLREDFQGVAEIRPNPFGVSPDWFDIRHRPSASRDWLVVSRVTRRKLGDLIEWGEGLFGETRRLRLLGPMQEEITLPPWIDYEGPTNPGSLQDRWFPEAAGLLTLSRHDEGRPQIMIEAMAAGLPVIASGIAAHADLICHAKTGWLVESREELVDALAQAETPSTASEIGRRTQTWMREQIGTWDDYALRCVDVYRDLVQKKSSNVG
jgi:hypothetical protein